VQAPSVQAAVVVATGAAAPSVQAPSVQATPPTDATYAITSGGGVNTNTSLNVQLTGGTSTPLQLLVSQIYMTPQTDGKCNLVPQQQNITLANVPTATFTPLNQLGNRNVTAVPVTSPSFSIEPGGTAYITLRANVDIPTMNRILTEVAPVVTPQAINSNDTTSTTPPIIAPLFITTASLPNVISGQNYNQTLSAIGGTLGSGACSAYSWSWSGASGSGTPPGLTLSQGGVISGVPTAPGTYNVLVQVGTCREESATRALSIPVAAPLIITTSSVPPGVQGVSYSTTLSSTGGIPPITWNVTGLPQGLNFGSNGTINGATAIFGTFPLQVRATDLSPSPQTANVQLGLTVFASTGNIAFVQQPMQAVGGQPISPTVTVRLIDNQGGVVPGVTVTIAIGNNPSGGVLSGTTTVLSDATGIATFSNLLIDKPGAGYTLIASATGAGGTSTNSFNIVVPTCAVFPTGYVPFITVFSIARDSAGDAFVVGGQPNGGIVAGLQTVPLPSAVNQQFCNPVTLETNYTVPAYVPTAAERIGDFTAYAGLTLMDPLTGGPFPGGNTIPANRLDTVFAWRIPRHSSTLPSLSCRFESTLHSIESNVATSIQFTNNTAGSVNVYWINDQGQRVFYRGGPFSPLAAGQSYVQGTFLTHPWIITDVATNSCLGIWLPTESPDTAVITGSAPPPAPPQAPTNLSAALQGGGNTAASVFLTWSASNNAVGYNVYRATVAAGPFTNLTSVPTPNLSFTDVAVSSGQTYYYFVTAVDTNGLESAYSNEMAASIP